MEQVQKVQSLVQTNLASVMAFIQPPVSVLQVALLSLPEVYRQNLQKEIFRVLGVLVKALVMKLLELASLFGLIEIFKERRQV